MHIHQGILSDLLPQVQTVIMLGSRASDHLRELARIAEFKGRAAYCIESASELQPRWFSGIEEVGVIVGSDNLQNELRGVLARLDQFSAAQNKGMLEGVAK
jgi:4-hydroxy-3-methylbut-2-enyl diphosphate reductase